MTDTHLELDHLPRPSPRPLVRRAALYTWLKGLTPSIWLSMLIVPALFLVGYFILLWVRKGSLSAQGGFDTRVFSGIGMVGAEIFLFVTIERGAEKLLRTIRPALLMDDAAFAQAQARCLRVSPLWEGAMLLPTALGPLGFYTYVAAEPDPVLRAYYLGGIALVALWLWQLIGAMTRGLWISAYLQHQPLAIDIFDSDDLAPLAKYGLVISLPGPMIFALMVLFWGFTPSGLSLFIYTMLLGTSALGFFLPLRGLHYRMEQAKARELEAVQTRVRQAYERLNQSAPYEEASRAQTLAYLLAAEARVQAAATWPFDIGILGQLAATLLIPLAIAFLQVWLSHLG